MRVDPFYVSNLATALDQTPVHRGRADERTPSGVSVTSLSSRPRSRGRERSAPQSDAARRFVYAILPGAGPDAGGGLGSGQRGQPANAGHLAGHQRQQWHVEFEPLKIFHLQRACRHSRRGHLYRRPSYQGQYIFGGGQTSTAPFSTDTAHRRQQLPTVAMRT